MPAPATHPSPVCNGHGDNKLTPPRRLKQQFAYDGDVAISGISGRLPESNNIQEFRDHLMKGDDMVTADDRRWPVGLHGLPPRCGKVPELTKFDAGFFGVHPKQADCMDPQLRMLLEASYEAIIDAGQSMESVRGSRTGVYIGVSLSDASDGWTMETEGMVGYTMPGCCRAMFANRLSFFFDFKGPSYAVDTACSSSMMCLDQALMGIRTGIIDSALVGGSNLCLKPNTSLQFTRMNMTSPDGACKTFDASANGYCRSEAIMAIFLQKVPDCKRIYATVVHTKSNCDGYKEQGITFPSGELQKCLINEVYDEIGINPADIAYMEAHGTGTKVGDPQEINSIVDVFCKDRTAPLLIGSTKTNMGHPEAASGLTSIAKIIISMEEGVIPPNLHYKNPNPEIPGLTDGSLQVVSECTKWGGGLVAMNSFGFGGANVHAIYKSNQKELKEPHPASQKPRLFTYAGRTEAGVRAVLAEARKNAGSVEFHALAEESAYMPTSMMPYRGSTVLNGSEEFEDVQKCGADPRPVWFVFAGMGTQWHGMGRKMMELDIFKDSIMRSTKTLSQYGVDLYDLIMNGDESTFDKTIPSFIGIASIQVALVDVLKAMEIKPDGIVGHSVGELGCAYADGSLTAEETVLAAYWRGRCISEATLPAGKMAAVGLSWEECKKQCPEGVVPACHNSIDTVTISGPYETTTKFVEELKAKGIFARDVKSSNVAYHSYYMKAIAPQLKEALSKFITPKPRSARWVSTSVPEARWDEDLAKYSSADYHVNNLVSPVLFQEGLQKVPANAIAIEIAPHGLLQAILKRSLSTESIFVSLMKRFHENNIEFLNASLGKCFNAGMNLRPLRLYPAVEFPVPRGTPNLSSVISKLWDHTSEWEAPTKETFDCSKGGSSSDAQFQIDISPESPEHYIVGHKIDGRVLYPATGYLTLAWRALARMKGQLYEQMPVVFQNISIHRATVLPPNDTVTLSVSIMPGTGDFEICEGESLVVSGIVSSPEGAFLDQDLYSSVASITSKAETAEFSLTREEVYKELRLRGYDYGPTFQGVVHASQTGLTGQLTWNGHWISFLDTMLHAQILSLPGQSLRLPTRIKSVKIDPKRQPAAPQEEDDPPVSIPYYVDNTLDMTVSGGVEVLGMHATVAPRRGQQTPPTLEEYRFVPYTSNPEITSSESLQQYATDCLSFALAGLRKLVDTDTAGVIPNAELLKEVLNNKKPPDTNGHSLAALASQPNSGLAKALVKLLSLPVSKSLSESAKGVLRSLKSELASDRLLSCLDTEDILKPCIDTAHENCGYSKLSVFEVGAAQSALYRKIVPFLKSQPVNRNFGYTAADKIPLEADAKDLGVKSSQWDPATAEGVPPGQSHMVVLKNVLHKQSDIDKAMEKFSEMLTPQGFLLVEEVTQKFPLVLALEALSDSIPEDSSKDLCRNCGRYLTEDSWLKVFSKHSYSVVFKKSDNMLSTMFLLRKQVKLSVSPVIMSIDDLGCSWLENLKSRVKEMEDAPEDSRIWIVSNSYNNGLVGFLNCLRFEAGGNKVRGVLTSNLNPSSKAPELSLDNKEFQSVVEKDLIMNVHRDGSWGSFRHCAVLTGSSVGEKQTDYAYVNVLKRGDLSSLSWIESPLKFFHQSGQDTELCSVYYTSLNFRDVMLATGKLPPDALPGSIATQDCIMGMEFSGRNTQGKRVMGILPAKGLATMVDTAPRFLWDVPDSWSMEEASTVPVVYCTAYYALVCRGRIQRGERVLIHSGSGGVGQAAISVALSYGCEVFTTVGSEEKKEYLKKMFPQLQDRNFSNSRDLSFEYHVLKETDGQGVDLVLNSLAEEKLQASVRLLARHGRFLEIGKFDLSNDTPLGMSVFLRNISFHGILLDALFEDETPMWHEVAQLVREGMASGVVRPLKATVFGKDAVEPAFRFMAQGKHIGKVVIQVRGEEPEKVCPAPRVSIPAVSRTSCDPSKSFVIAGGLGGFGLELAQWLVNRGAKKIVISSRSGIKTGYQKRKVTWWKDAGVDVVISKADTRTPEGAKDLIREAAKLGPVAAVFNLAMVLCDGLFENQTPDMYKQVVSPKVAGSIHLDAATRELCRDSLEWFVLFSSVSCGRGNLGQTNYGFANSVMERICEKRAADGLSALAIQWGAIGDVGVIIESMGGNDTVIGGTVPQRIASSLDALEKFLNQPQLSVVSSFVLHEPDAGKKEGGAAGNRPNLVEAVRRILGVKTGATVDPETTLADLGLDSLMSVEIKQLLERDFDLSLSTREIRGLNLQKLQEMDGDDDSGVGEEADSEESEEATSSPDMRFDFNEMVPKTTVLHMNEVQNGLKPLFIVHPIEGSTRSLSKLAKCLPCPVYGLQLTADAPLTSIEDLAAFYIKQLETIDKSGPYRLAGYSFGSLVVLEMATQLRKQNPDRPDMVQSLTLLDGSHRFVELYTNTYRKVMQLNSTADDQAMSICAFLQKFTQVDVPTVFKQLASAADMSARVQIAADVLMATGQFNSRDDLATLTHAFYAMLTIGEQYKPAVYPGDITLVRAEQNSVSSASLGDDYGLSQVCKGTIKVEVVDGDHETFILGNGAKKVAEVMIPQLP